MKASPRQGGFTLIEVILSISLLLLISIAATTMIRNSLRLRVAIGETDKVSHRLNVAMQTIANDLQHAFILETLRPELNFIGRTTKAVFQQDREGFRLTTMSHRPVRAGSGQSDQTYITYELKKSEVSPDRTDLLRGVSPGIPASFNDDVPAEVLVRSIKALELKFWDGDRWVEAWDTNKGDFRNMLPGMVRVEIEAWDYVPEGEAEKDEEQDKFTSRLSTIVYLPRSWGLKEKKDISATSRIKWF